MRTANHKSPLQLFTAGLLLLQNSQLSALDFFDNVDELYGIDSQGPVSVASDRSGIEIPQNTLRFSEQDVYTLKQSIPVHLLTTMELSCMNIPYSTSVT